MSWFYDVPIQPLIAPSVSPSVAIHSEQIDQTLKVEWRHKVADLENQTLTFSGGVKAYYRETVLSAQSLTLHLKPGEEKGIADGNVLIEDPEGMIKAKHFEFSWTLKTGFAQDVEVHVERLVVMAASIDVKPDVWTLSKATALPCPEEPGRIRITSESVLVYPGKNGVAKKVSLNVFGNKIITLPRHSFSLDKRTAGITWPSLSYRRGTGVGVTWSSDLEVARNTFASGSFSAFSGRRPRTDFMLSQDLLKSGSERAIRPASELGDPFSDSFLDNVLVKTPEDEHGSLASRVFTAGIGSSWNLNPRGSVGGGSISKPWDIAIEAGGLLGSFAVVGQVRYERIGVNGGPYIQRAVASTAVGLPSYTVAPKLSTLARVDARYYSGEGNFGWARGTAGLTWSPNNQVRLSAARTFTVDTGTPYFAFDDLERRHSWLGRLDLNLGPTKISVLGKYDSKTRSLFDREIYFSQIAGCFEPYIFYRQDPRRFGFGFRLRSFDVLERLKNRDLQKQEKVPKAPHLIVIK